MKHPAALLVGGLAIATALFAHPAVVDIPVHVVRFRLMADLLDGNAANPFYALDLRWLPNTLLDTVFTLLALALPAETLGRLAAALPVIVVGGTVVWCRRILYPGEPHPVLALLLALPLLLLGETYLMGLHSFMISLCAGVAGYVALFRGPGLRLSYAARQGLAAVLVAGVCWLHIGGLLGVVLPALGDGMASVMKTRQGSGSFLRRLAMCAVDLAGRYVGLVVPVLIVIALLPVYIAGMEIQNEPTSADAPSFRIGAWLVTRIEAALSPTSILFEIRVLNAWWGLTALCLLGLALAIALLHWPARKAGRAACDAGFLWAAAIAVPLILALPEVSANTAFVHWRPAFALMVFLTLATSPRGLTRNTVRLAGACTGLVLAVKAATFVALSADTTRTIAEFRAASSVVAPRSTVFLARAVDGDDRPPWRRSANIWQLDQHAAAFAALDRDALVPNLFIGRGTQNLVLRGTYRDFAVPSAIRLLPVLLAMRPTRALGPGISQSERLAHWRERVDYLAVSGWHVERLTLPPDLGPPLYVSQGLRIHRVPRQR